MGSTLLVDELKGVTGVGDIKLPANYIVQVINAERTTITAQGGTTYADTGLTLNITPKYATSKIMVCVRQYFTFRTASTSERQADFRLMQTISGGSATQVAFQRINQWTISSASAHYFGKMCAFDKLDSPATTSQINYKTQFKLNATSADLYTSHDGAISTITAMEIAQ